LDAENKRQQRDTDSLTEHAPRLRECESHGKNVIVWEIFADDAMLGASSATSLTLSNWSTVLTTNGTNVTLPVNASAAFYRVLANELAR
jgi:hypothetical protein